MWPFKRKKEKRGTDWSNPVCPHCGSNRTSLASHGDSDSGDYVKAWRGQRYITCRCSACGRDFYLDEPSGGLPSAAFKNEQLVDDEEALRAAEDELKRNADEDNDHTFR
jgi:hypothetical protein